MITAGTNGMLAVVTKEKATKAPNVIKESCEKLKVFVAFKSSTKPKAISAYILPTANPEIINGKMVAKLFILS